jgi:DNA-binding CsgD family transcriptional regulator
VIGEDSSITSDQARWGEHHQTGSAPWLPSATELMGRTAELEMIDALLHRREGVDPSLLLSGAPGVGKTALLDAAAAQAAVDGMRVLRGVGVEFESEIPFAALHQMLYPVREHVDRLAGHHRDALGQVFDLAPGSSPVPLVAAAVLALLSEVAAERPLLVIVDGVPWIDRASATVLAFAARRIGDDPIAFLAATRTGAGGFFDKVGLAEREIGSLATQPATSLLDTRWPGLAPTVRARLLDEAAGNPLALRELPGLLTDRQRCGEAPLPTFLALNGRLEAIFAAGLQALPAPERQVLLLAALEPDASLDTIRSAAHGRADDDDLAEAQQAGVVRMDAVSGPVVFRHPLIRSAIVQASSPGERRAAHQALAAALAGDPERRAWHLAEAATGPDEAVAEALDEAALAAWHRGDPSTASAGTSDQAAVSSRRRRGAAAAVTLKVRAGELSSHPAGRSRRLVEAAYLAVMSGQLDQAPRLLADAGQGSDTPTGLVFAATAYLLTTGEGEIDAAHQLLARALDEVADTATTTNDRDSRWILHALLVVSIYAARPEPWELLNTALARFAPEAVTPFRLCYDAYVDPAGTADTVREGLANGFAALSADASPWPVVPLTWAAVAVDGLADYRYLVRRVIERERDSGAVTMVVAGLLLLCIDSYGHGEWDEAENLAREALDLAMVYGHHLTAGQLRCHLAYIAAARGDVDYARALTDEITTWAVRRGVGLPQAYVGRVRTLAALGQGDYEEAYVQAARANPPGEPSAGVPGRLMVMDLVEAAVRTGRTEEARSHVAAAQQAGIARISTRMALISAGAAALAADDDEADQLFDAALSLPEADRWPFEQARIQFAYGQWLRRTRDTARARLHLRDAIETFERMGARPWAQQAHSELRATGVATTGRPDAPKTPLTAQERQIAELAATGLTNKQIGERLFLSHRTVGSHLHRLYPKLGITSRAALRAALEMITPEENGTARPASQPKIMTTHDLFRRPMAERH